MSILLLIVVALFGGCAYLACPVPIQLILFAINFFVPDPIPFLDEAVMVGGILSKLLFIEDVIDNVMDFIAEHKRLSAILGIILLIVILNLIF